MHMKLEKKTKHTPLFVYIFCFCVWYKRNSVHIAMAPTKSIHEAFLFVRSEADNGKDFDSVLFRIDLTQEGEDAIQHSHISSTKSESFCQLFVNASAIHYIGKKADFYAIIGGISQEKPEQNQIGLLCNEPGYSKPYEADNQNCISLWKYNQETAEPREKQTSTFECKIKGVLCSKSNTFACCSDDNRLYLVHMNEKKCNYNLVITTMELPKETKWNDIIKSLKEHNITNSDGALVKMNRGDIICGCAKTPSGTGIGVLMCPIDNVSKATLIAIVVDISSENYTIKQQNRLKFDDYDMQLVANTGGTTLSYVSKDFLSIQLCHYSRKIKWNKERQLWIGLQKNCNNNKCYLSRIPKDVLGYIIKFLP